MLKIPQATFDNIKMFNDEGENMRTIFSKELIHH
jgi:hypothetical protein